MITDDRKATTPARILAAGPAEARVKVIGAVHENGAGLDPVANPRRPVNIACPDTGGQAESYCRSLISIASFIILHRHDPHHRAKAFIAHHPHVVGDVGQDLRCQIGSAIVLGQRSRYAPWHRPPAPRRSVSRTSRANRTFAIGPIEVSGCLADCPACSRSRSPPPFRQRRQTGLSCT